MNQQSNIEKQYIFKGLTVSFLPKEKVDMEPFTFKLKLSEVITTGELRTIVSDTKLKFAFDRHCEKLGISVPYPDMKLVNNDVTVRHVLGECGHCTKDSGFSKVYCSTSGFTLKPLQTRTGADVQHALFPLYNDWKISEVSVDWDIESGTKINISTIIQQADSNLQAIPVCSISSIANLPKKYEYFIDAIEASLTKAKAKSTTPLFYKDVQKISE